MQNIILKYFFMNIIMRHLNQFLIEAYTKFYCALNAIFKDDTEPMNQIWSHSEDVTYLPPTGRIKTGW